MTKEPVAIVGAIVLVVQTVLGVAVAFGAHISDLQMTAIQACVSAVVALVGIVIARARVTPLPPPPPPVK